MRTFLQPNPNFFVLGDEWFGVQVMATAFHLGHLRHPVRARGNSRDTAPAAAGNSAGLHERRDLWIGITVIAIAILAGLALPWL
jgi:hypothetical protein